jgi:hypothetical protein
MDFSAMNMRWKHTDGLIKRCVVSFMKKPELPLFVTEVCVPTGKITNNKEQGAKMSGSGFWCCSTTGRSRIDGAMRCRSKGQNEYEWSIASRK